MRRTGGVRSAGAEVQTVVSYLTLGPDIELVSSVRAVFVLLITKPSLQSQYILTVKRVVALSQKY